MKKVMLVAVLLGFAQSDAMLSDISRTSISPNVSLSRLFVNAVQKGTNQITKIARNETEQTEQPIVIGLGKETLASLSKINEKLYKLDHPVRRRSKKEVSYGDDLALGWLIGSAFAKIF